MCMCHLRGRNMFLLGCSLREEATSAVGGSRWPPVELKSGLGWGGRTEEAITKCHTMTT